AITTIGEEVDGRRRIMWRSETPQDWRNEIPNVGDGAHFVDPWSSHENVARRAFLEQQLGGLHARLGVKAPAHDAVKEDVVECDERRPLMMRHVSAHDGHSLLFGDARGRV